MDTPELELLVIQRKVNAASVVLIIHIPVGRWLFLHRLHCFASSISSFGVLCSPLLVFADSFGIRRL